MCPDPTDPHESRSLAQSSPDPVPHEYALLLPTCTHVAAQPHAFLHRLFVQLQDELIGRSVWPDALTLQSDLVPIVPLARRTMDSCALIRHCAVAHDVGSRTVVRSRGQSDSLLHLPDFSRQCFSQSCEVARR